MVKQIDLCLHDVCYVCTHAGLNLAILDQSSTSVVFQCSRQNMEVEESTEAVVLLRNGERYDNFSSSNDVDYTTLVSSISMSDNGSIWQCASSSELSHPVFLIVDAGKFIQPLPIYVHH